MIHKKTFMPFLLATLGLILYSCAQTEKKEKDIFLPNVTGTANEIIAVIESYQWQSDIGEGLMKVFKKAVTPMPQPEPMFDLVHITPSAFANIFKPHRNLVFIKLSPEYTEANIIVQKNIYAKPQTVLNIVAPNEPELLNYLEQKGDKIRAVFLDAERNRIIDYYKKYEEKSIRDKLIEEHNIGLIIPKGYKLDVDLKDFIWISHEDPDVKQNIFIYFYNYTDKETFTAEYLIKKRNETLKAHVPGPVNGSYVSTEQIITPEFAEVSYKNRYFAQLKGLWKMENYFMGGPFISFTTLDKKNNRVITVEGLVFAPNINKRDYLRQLEGILYTFYIPEK